MREVNQEPERRVTGGAGGSNAGADDNGDQEARAGELGEEAPADGVVHAGLTARMMAEWMPGAASLVKVTEASM